MRMGIVAMLVALMGGLAADASAGDAPDEFGIRFWKAVSEADTEKMATGYSPQVTLVAGSELLKKEWGLNPGGDRGKDLQVKREDLVVGYRAMIAKVGVEKWKGIFSNIGRNRISFAAAQEADQVLKGVRRGDVLMRVATGPGDDTLTFVLSRKADTTWCVRMEATDY